MAGRAYIYQLSTSPILTIHGNALHFEIFVSNLLALAYPPQTRFFVRLRPARQPKAAGIMMKLILNEHQ
jgi:hypothetical protein